MKRLLLAALSACLMWSVVAPAVAIYAQAQTATQFYMEYRKAFDAAKKIDDLLPYLSAKTKAQITATPAGERGQMFEMMKMMGTITNVKVTRETASGANTMLAVEALDPDKKPTVGTITVVKEGGAWKIGTESWSSKS